ncbi:hypothetical protein QO014_001028 [Kaistia dalseonensis]|uniref:Uncharacterized protein n=1 Tax=Kaistia dalseonensis TaxID=410840 RepID=A0ABU0H2X6_9HYPH|nr:hypothetical protein [Kaistia dalseonensis]
MIGTMLGFVTGSGILATSSTVSDRTGHVRQQEELQRVG